ncbi:MAG: rhodanese-like domain-containing protein [Syntrophales bacterium]
MHVMKRFVVMAGLLLVAVLPSMAAEKGRAEPYTVVTTEELKAMLDRQEPDMVIIDARNPEEYQEVHIRTAVNIPWPELERGKTLLNFPKEMKLVFYCNGFK